MKIVIRVALGATVKSSVDEFIHRHGGNGIARESDLFFLAYDADRLLGSVRFCVEEDTPMLRTMMIDEGARRKGIGSLLLENFRKYLDENSHRNVYCIPYGHLTEFYSQIGFEVVDENLLPAFLQERLKGYRSKSTKTYAAMRRL